MVRISVEFLEEVGLVSLYSLLIRIDYCVVYSEQKFSLNYW